MSSEKQQQQYGSNNPRSFSDLQQQYGSNNPRSFSDLQQQEHLYDPSQITYTHSQFSRLYPPPPPSSLQYPPPTSSQYPPPTSSQYPPPTSSQYPPPTSSQYPPPTSSQYPPPTSSQYPPPTSSRYPPPTSSQFPPPISSQYPPPTSSQFPPPISSQYPPPISSQRSPSPSQYLQSNEETKNSLEVYFRGIEEIISKAQNQFEVRQAVAERFALLLPEELHEHINDYVIRGKKHSSREGSTSTSSTPTTPILNNEAENIVRKKSKRSKKQHKHPTSVRQPMNDYEKQLVKDGLELPLKYFNSVNGFPFSGRPEFHSPKSLVNHKTHIEYNQKQLTQIIVSSTVPEKWLSEHILNELRPLFLRIRTLDIVKKNEILRGFLSRLFPDLARENRSKLDDLAKHFRTSAWSDWRHNLWVEIQNNYNQTYKDFDLTELFVQDKHVKAIFRLWLTNTSSDLPQGAIDALKTIILIGFRSIYNNPNNNKDARHKFYKLHTDLYTVDINFESASGNNIAASLDLSKYEFVKDSDDDD